MSKVPVVVKSNSFASRLIVSIAKLVWNGFGAMSDHVQVHLDMKLLLAHPTAKRKQLELLRRSVTNWKTWRENNPTVASGFACRQLCQPWDFNL